MFDLIAKTFERRRGAAGSVRLLDYETDIAPAAPIMVSRALPRPRLHFYRGRGFDLPLAARSIISQGAADVSIDGHR
jgi:hypothetical protein